MEREGDENNEPAKEGKKAITDVLHHVSTPCVTIRSWTTDSTFSFQRARTSKLYSNGTAQERLFIEDCTEGMADGVGEWI